jgi:preprotein translocase subunit SecA
MSLLTEDHRLTDLKTPLPLPAGLDASLHGLGGRWRRRAVLARELMAQAQSIEDHASTWKDLSEDGLKQILAHYAEVFRRQKRGFENALPRALGALREAADRTLGLRPYPVQLAGALALYHGNVAEMATGEGKTLTAGLAAVLWGWSGRPCHVVTVNDYLAARDAKRLSPFFEYCGLTAGAVTGEMDPAARRQGHAKDITYTTSKEIVADFLRDRLWLDTLQDPVRRQVRLLAGRRQEVEKGLVMRGIHSVIVDEADSVLVDEAVTPLIISRSRPNEPFVEACRAAHKIAADLIPGLEYSVDESFKDVTVLPPLESRLAEEAEALPALFRGPGRREELIRQALNAREFFHRDKQYVVQDGKVVIVDEFTGRPMPQRTWRAGLHQMIEAKEGLEVTPPSETLARLSFQRFFRFFRRMSGMTGTAREAAPELWRVYDLPVLSIPRNRPDQRADLPRRVFPDQASKWAAVVAEIVEMHRAGRPVLAGTRSVQASEELARMLEAAGVSCRVLNAVRHAEEAEVIARAGVAGAVTVATNMAGRGTDVLLADNVPQAGGLHVIATECHESARIDRQLFGRAGRQGDPGSARAFVSLEDELIRRFVPGRVREALQRALVEKKPLSDWAAGLAVRWAQARAQRLSFQSRRAVLLADTWLENSLSFAPGDVAQQP